MSSRFKKLFLPVLLFIVFFFLPFNYLYAQEGRKRIELGMRASLSFPTWGEGWADGWIGMEAGLFLTKHIELMGNLDLLLFCDTIGQANCAYNFALNNNIDFLAIAGIGSHSCHDAGETTPMVNLGTGIRMKSKPAIKLEYRAHIKFNKSDSPNFTNENIHVISVSMVFSF